MESQANFQMNNDEMEYSEEHNNSRHSDDSLGMDSVQSNHLEKAYDEIVEEMETFKEGLTKKIKAF